MQENGFVSTIEAIACVVELGITRRTQNGHIRNDTCDDGKEGVDGSSPSEGFRKRPAYRGSLLSVTTLGLAGGHISDTTLVARVADNGLCRAPFRTRKLLDHMRVRRKHHGGGMARGHGPSS
jgi:hypothetical protein